MKQIITYCLVGTLFLLSSCQKNKLPKVEESGDPVFFVKCQVNGVPLKLQAGMDNYEMKSSYYQDKNQLYVYKSQLTQNCVGNATCGYEFTILINDNKFPDSGTSNTNADKALVPGKYNFGMGTYDPLYYIGTFKPTFINQGSQYTWQLGDSSMTGVEVSKMFAANKVYSVSLTNTSSNCSISLQHDFKIGNPLHTTVAAAHISGTKYLFSASTDPAQSYEYEWYFGDGTPISRDANPEHTYASSANYYFPYLKLTDKDKNTCIAYYQIAPSGGCNANFISSFVPVHNAAALSTITLLIKDPKGVVYSSNDIQQLVDSKFQIVSVEDYAVNENGEKTKKIKVNFSCKVKDGNDVISITDGEAVIAAAYK